MNNQPTPYTNMGSWKHDACYLQEQWDAEERDLYSAEQDYLHGLYEASQPIVNADPGDEHQPRETAHNNEVK